MKIEYHFKNNGCAKGASYLFALFLSSGVSAQDLAHSKEIEPVSVVTAEVVKGLVITAWRYSGLPINETGQVVVPQGFQPKWERIEQEQSVGLEAGDLVKFCVGVSKDGYAKIWDESPTGKTVIVPNQYTLNLQYITSNNDAMVVRASEEVCVGDSIKDYMLRVSDDEKGPHRLFVQWAEDPSQLYSEDDYPVLSKTLGDVGSTPDGDLSEGQRSALKQGPKFGVTNFSYYVY